MFTHIEASYASTEAQNPPFFHEKNLTGRKNLDRPGTPKGHPKHYKTPWMDGQHGHNKFQTIF